MLGTELLLPFHPIGVIAGAVERWDKGPVRMVAARILVVLGVLLAALSLLAGYVRFQALDTPTVKKTAGKLIADDQIRNQVATSLVDQLYANVDVPAELAKRLPPDQKGLAGPLSAALREFSNRAAQRLLERPQVQALWVETVTRAHTQLNNVLNVGLSRSCSIAILAPVMAVLPDRLGRAACPHEIAVIEPPYGLHG